MPSIPGSSYFAFTSDMIAFLPFFVVNYNPAILSSFFCEHKCTAIRHGFVGAVRWCVNFDIIGFFYHLLPPELSDSRGPFFPGDMSH